MIQAKMEINLPTCFPHLSVNHKLQWTELYIWKKRTDREQCLIAIQLLWKGK